MNLVIEFGIKSQATHVDERITVVSRCDTALVELVGPDPSDQVLGKFLPILQLLQTGSSVYLPAGVSYPSYPSDDQLRSIQVPVLARRDGLRTAEAVQHDIESRHRRVLDQTPLDATSKQPLPDPPRVQAGQIGDLCQQPDRVALQRLIAVQEMLEDGRSAGHRRMALGR